ncbi:TIGR01777 family oxidoreductase [uncultured Desulfobacter sp.]|uniref:TIGR01777 family oxidoreductase n=1 Tax=uncultured Desulfobacter sp. TaxID=240139 RepID=UPI0029F4EE1C|nr:TIGR01777 family oxidoreductase [uncultured Desulfobacter sp.]
MKTVLITGASGFVGQALARKYIDAGWQVNGLGTSLNHPMADTYDNFSWTSADTSQPGAWQDLVAQSDVIVNLAGRNIFKPWTKAYKKAIYDSRIKTTKHLVDAMPGAFDGQLINASAAGFYGDRGDTSLTETESSGTGFLAQVCRDWEAQAQKAASKGATVAVMRFGVVLGSDGGALDVMSQAFRMFVGGPLGTGNQWFPWIHLDDLIRGIFFLVEHKAQGLYNFTGPVPIRQKEFAKELGRALHRPAFMPAPAFFIRLFMGQLGDSFLCSQKALPAALETAGFRFEYHTVGGALAQIYNS